MSDFEFPLADDAGRDESHDAGKEEDPHAIAGVSNFPSPDEGIVEFIKECSNNAEIVNFHELDPTNQRRKNNDVGEGASDGIYKGEVCDCEICETVLAHIDQTYLFHFWCVP